MRVYSRTEEVLDFIVDFIDTNKYPPSVRTIGAAVGMKSTGTVHSHLKRLREQGRIEWNDREPRTIVLKDVQ